MNNHWAPLYVVPPGHNVTNSTDRPYHYTVEKTVMPKKVEEEKKVELFIPPELDKKNQNSTKIAVNTTRKAFLPPELQP